MLDLGSFGPAAAAPDAVRTMPAAQAGEPAGDALAGGLFGSFVDALADASEGGAQAQRDGDDHEGQFVPVPVDVAMPITPIPLTIALSSATTAPESTVEASTAGSTINPQIAVIKDALLDLPLTAPTPETGTMTDVELPSPAEDDAVDLPLWPLADEADQSAPPIDQASLAKLKKAMAQADAAMTFRAALRTGVPDAAGEQETSTTAASSALRHAVDAVARAFANTTAVKEHAAAASGADRVALIPTLLGSAASPSDRVAIETAITAFMDQPNEDTATQIVHAIKLQWSRGIGEAHIRLEPQQFGGLTVSLKVEDGEVIARLQSDTPVIREWLQSNQAALRQSLADQHLTLGRLEVTEPSDETRHDDRRERPAEERPSRPAPRRSRRDGAGETFEIVA